MASCLRHNDRVMRPAGRGRSASGADTDAGPWRHRWRCAWLDRTQCSNIPGCRVAVLNAAVEERWGLGGAACHAASPVRAAPDRRPAGRPPAAGQPSGVLMASPRTVSGRASAERGRGRRQRAYCGGGRLTGCCRDSDRPHAPRPGPPAAAAHHRQSGDPDRIPAARRAQRPARGRPLRESDRHHRAPGISRSWPQNGRITAQ